MSFTIETYQSLLSESHIVWSAHCLEHMQKRDISREEILYTIQTGKIIENYDDDFPHPSCLILGFVEGDPFHVVCGCDSQQIYIITAYIPTVEKFGPNYDERI